RATCWCGGRQPQPERVRPAILSDIAGEKRSAGIPAGTYRQHIPDRSETQRCVADHGLDLSLEGDELMSRFIRLAVPAAILAAIAFVAMPREASSTMHLTLRSSIPSEDTVLTASPEEISLTYSQAPMLRVTRVTVTGPDSAVVKVGAPALAQGSTVTVV